MFDSISRQTSNLEYYNKYSIDHNIKAQAGVSQEKLESMYKNLIYYINTEKKEYLSEYNERESSHMEDVGKIYKINRNISVVGYFLVILFYGYFLFAEDTFRKYENIKYIRNTLLGILFVFGVLFLIIYINFDSSFVTFHKIFFNNDLWLLDPKTDIMIRMLPQGYFMSVAFNIIKNFLFFSLLPDIIILTLYLAFFKYTL